MAKACVIHETGGPEVIRFEDVAVPPPGPGEVRLRQIVVGVNFIDIYRRSGLYPLNEGLPAILGCEAVGVVEDVGPGVRGFRPGDRVGYASSHGGSYAEARVIHTNKLVHIPDGIGDRDAAASLVRGLTAEYLLFRCLYRPGKGDTILVHAAAGGVGLMLCQWAKHLGCTVIGTVGSRVKAEIARENGCDHPIVYTEEDFVARVKEITNGKMVPVVYDSVGKNTFLKSLDCLRPRGLMVSFGNASGSPDPIAPRELQARGSLYLTRPMLDHYVEDPRELRAAARRLFAAIASGAVKARPNHVYPLAEAARAQVDLESRRTTGAVILTI